MKYTTYDRLQETSISSPSSVENIGITHLISLGILIGLAYYFSQYSVEIFSQDGEDREVDYCDFSTNKKTYDYLTNEWQIIYLFVFGAINGYEFFNKYTKY